MYERFTDRTRKVMKFADQEAHRLNHLHLEPEHILLGLIKEGGGVAACALKHLGVDLDLVRSRIEKVVSSGADKVSVKKRRQTARTKRVIECAMEEVRFLSHTYVGTEHLLLGMLREQENMAAQVLANVGLTLETVRREVVMLLGQGIDE